MFIKAVCQTTRASSDEVKVYFNVAFDPKQTPSKEPILCKIHAGDARFWIRQSAKPRNLGQIETIAGISTTLPGDEAQGNSAVLTPLCQR